MNNLKLLIMTGSKLRHYYFAISLLKHFDNSKAFIEKHYDITTKNYVKEETPLIVKHFKDFEAIEKEFFQDFVEQNRDFLEKNTVKVIEPGTINEPENVEFIKSLNPKVIAIHSTSLLKEEIINAFPKRLINLHAGLSPYYRGSGTNLYPFYNKELEYVGMTVHYIDKGIDSGEIILQGRPEFEEKDNTHTVGCKNVILGTKLMIKVIERYLKEGQVPSIKQNLEQGKLYLKKEFNDDIIKTVYKNIENGLVKEYMQHPKNVKIVEWAQ